MTFHSPSSALGADLFWWREGGGMHTIVTVHSLSFRGLIEGVALDCVLFDAAGQPAATWQVSMEGREFYAIDSAQPGEWSAAPGIESGMLALYVTGRFVGREGEKYRRLYSMVDWYSDRGDIAGLHNDQSIVRGRTKPDAITEIAILESPRDRNSLVFLNGERPQEVAALTIVVTNAGGASREATYSVPMSPFTVHRAHLASLFPGLDAFGGGEKVSVTGHFTGDGLYTRPYVVTEGERLSAYHGGDLYSMAPLPAMHYRILGAGEVNPMAVVHRPGEVETGVNFFNSHGDLEESFWVDAELFDERGRSVARREKWRCARRHALTSASVAELIPNPAEAFAGHIAFTFTAAEVPMFPRRLQALLEYRSAGGVAHVMAWSDEWNSRARMHTRARQGALPLRSYYRVICRAGFSTWVSLTNAGHGAYREEAALIITLVNSAGKRASIARSLGPHATLFENVNALFPDAERFLGKVGVGVVEVESTFDLANVQFTRRDATGAWAAEHFLAAATRDGDRVEMPAGS